MCHHPVRSGSLLDDHGCGARPLSLPGARQASATLRLSGNYSLQHAHNEAGLAPGLAPQRRLFARADWRLRPSMQLGATLNYVADRAREPEDSRPKIADDTTLDLHLRTENFFGNWEARFALKNALNRDAREPSFYPVNLPLDLPLPRRSFYLQLQTAL